MLLNANTCIIEIFLPLTVVSSVTRSFPRPSVHVTSPGLDVTASSASIIFCAVVVVITVIVLSGFWLIIGDFVVAAADAAVFVVVVIGVLDEDNGVDSVMGLLFDRVDIFVVVAETLTAGLFVGRRVTNVFLTVDVLICIGVANVGLCVEGFALSLSSADITENVVVNSSSSVASVDKSTLIIVLVGLGRGLGAFVVSTNEIVVNIAGFVDDAKSVLDVNGSGFLVEFLLAGTVGRRFTVVANVDWLLTGFLVVVFITVDVVAFFDGFGAIGRRDGFIVVNIVSLETDVRFVVETGFLELPLVGFVNF
jgi:hypothetical protein